MPVLVAGIHVLGAGSTKTWMAGTGPAATGHRFNLNSSGTRRRPVDVQEVKKLDAYLKKLFANPRIRVVPRPKKDDSAEVYVGDEFVGVLFVDDEDDERSYNFQMAILGTDLD
jgi:Protein of unknown function (DUF3126)